MHLPITFQVTQSSLSLSHAQIDNWHTLTKISTVTSFLTEYKTKSSEFRLLSNLRIVRGEGSNFRTWNLTPKQVFWYFLNTWLNSISYIIKFTFFIERWHWYFRIFNFENFLFTLSFTDIWCPKKLLKNSFNGVAKDWEEKSGKIQNTICLLFSFFADHFWIQSQWRFPHQFLSFSFRHFTSLSTLKITSDGTHLKN